MNVSTKGSWTVFMRCVVTKSVVCVDCTEAEAHANPYDHTDDNEEIELEQIDYDVTRVVPLED